MGKREPLQDSDKKSIEVQPPKVDIRKVGVVSHDYRQHDFNSFRDYSYTFKETLEYLDSRGCDSVLFALYTIIQRKGYTLRDVLDKIKLKNIKYVFLEEFEDKEDGKNKYVIFYKKSKHWQEYKIFQKFGTLQYTRAFREKTINPFVDEVQTQRNFGNCTILLCGESNIVKYSPKLKEVRDDYNYLKAITSDVRVILNPIHDRMTRFEMKLKRKFLSRNNRWVISVWNKGKEDKNGTVKDGTDPAWTVFYNEKEVRILKENCNISSKTNIEIGIIDFLIDASA